jgi:hypothetical protein
MENTKNENTPFMANWMFNPNVRKCDYCKEPIIGRTRKAKYCGDSCRELAFLRRHSENSIEGSTNNVNTKIEESDVKNKPILAEEKSLGATKDPSVEVNKEIDPWKNATKGEKLELKLKLRVAWQIEKCVNSYLKNEMYEIPKNKIHSLLLASEPIIKCNQLEFPKFVLRLSSDKKNYLICTNK